MTRSPKKTAALGLSLLVAAYFWAPLLLGGASDDATTETVATSEGAPTASTTVPIAATAAAQPLRPSWSELVAWMETDRLMQAATFDASLNPFFEALTETPTAEDEPATDAQPVALLTPEQLGLRLSSVIISPRARIARVSGQSYREDDRIAVPETAADDVQLIVERIYPDHIVINRDGQTYELWIQDYRSDSGSMTVERRRTGS